MSRELEQRIRKVNENLANAPVSIGEINPELIKIVATLCDYFKIGYGTLIRRAWSIAILDGNLRPDLKHFQEAVQHIILTEDVR
jgi:hypothetical protein